MVKSEFLAYFVLASFYTCFFFYCLVKSYSFYQFHDSWKAFKGFYVLLTVQNLCRLFCYWLLCFSIRNVFFPHVGFSFLLVSVPETLFIGAYIFMFWILLRIYHYTHRELEEFSPGKENSRVVLVLLVWLGLQTTMYVLMYLAFFGQSVIELLIAVENSVTGIAMIGVYLRVRAKFRNYRSKSSYAKKFRVTVVRTCLFWAFGRLLKASFYCIDQFELVDDLAAETGSKDIVVTLSVITLMVLSELLCTFLVLDQKFFDIFLSNLEEIVIETSLIETPHAPDPFESLQPEPVLLSYFNSMSSPFIESKEIVLRNKVSEGKKKFGDLYTATFKTQPVMVRRLTLSQLSGYLLKQLRLEIKELKKLEAPNLLPFIGARIHLPHVDFLMPYIVNGSLYSALHTRNVLFSLKDKLRITLQVATCMKELHRQNKVHGHLTSQNVLLDFEWKALVADFGLLHFKKFTGLLIGYRNKSSWSSPEQLKKSARVVSNPRFNDDVYSFGVLMWEIFTGKVPFEGAHWRKLRKKVVKQGLRPGIPAELPKEIRELIQICWCQYPHTRPSFTRIYNKLCELECQD